MKDQRNRGVLFSNDRKKPGSQDPDFTGRCSAVCPKCGMEMGHFLAAWITRAKSGLVYWKLQFQAKVDITKYGKDVETPREDGEFPWER